MPGEQHDTTALTFTQVQYEEGLDDWRMMFQTLETRYATGSFATGLELVSRIGAVAEELDHHPELDLRFATLHVRLISRDVFGVTSRDLELARRRSSRSGVPCSATTTIL